MPQIAYLDVSNACPLSCPLCPTGKKESSAVKGLMKFSTFKKIFDEIGPYLYELHLYNWGEPLLNQDLPEMIRYAKSRYDVDVILSTTLMKVSKDLATELIKAKPDLISLSIDGATQEVYEKYRVGGKLDEIFATLRLMVDVKDTLGQKKPLLRWQFIPMKHNEHEIETARKMASEMGVAFRTHRVRLNVTNFDKKDFKDILEENKDWLPKDEKYIRYDDSGAKSVCKFLWDRVIVNFDGSIAPCCKIYTKEDLFTDKYPESFQDVWNGEKYQKARAIFTGTTTDKDFVCQRCFDRDGNI